ncbi:MAG: metallophosphoesterase [Gammaproteobacteria bacterium]|nr:metallophosphoesterase [Gammaproteobacteria bacterium]
MRLTVLQITDTHLLESPLATMHGVNTQKSLEAVLERGLSEVAPDLVLATGDIAETPGKAVYRRFRDTVTSRYGGPFVCVPGNHDRQVPFESVLSRSRHTAAGWDIIGIDTHIEDHVEGYVHEAELRRLDAELAAADGDVVVVGHHCPVEIGSPVFDRHRIVNGEELTRLLNVYNCVRAYVCGHIHQPFDTFAGDVRILATPSTCFQYASRNADSLLDDDSAPGYRWIELGDDGRFDTGISRIDGHVRE